MNKNKAITVRKYPDRLFFCLPEFNEDKFSIMFSFPPTDINIRKNPHVNLSTTHFLLSCNSVFKNAKENDVLALNKEEIENTLNIPLSIFEDYEDYGRVIIASGIYHGGVIMPDDYFETDHVLNNNPYSDLPKVLYSMMQSYLDFLYKYGKIDKKNLPAPQKLAEYTSEIIKIAEKSLKLMSIHLKTYDREELKDKL